MFMLNNQVELRRVTISSLITCIYLPSIVTVISYKGLLYSVGKGSSFYILVLIFLAELLKSFYLNSSNDLQAKKYKGSKNRAGDVLKALGFLLGVNFCFFVGVILFGAPVLDCHEETLMFSTLMTLLTVFPLVAHTGVETAMQLLFGARGARERAGPGPGLAPGVADMLVGNAALAACGAWAGAVAVPLDWAVPWQEWPVPCYLGALGGYLLSNVLNVLKVALLTAAHKYPALDTIVNILNNVHSK